MNQIIGGTTIRLHQDDNVVVAAQNIGAGATIPGEGVVTASAVPSGHKIATRAISAGDYVRKYNQIIGVATADIAPGAHVHVQNCAMSEFERDYAFCADARPTQYFTGQDRATFKGIVREDGRVATPQLH
ncbi:MAG: UxaA family hydrolase, partial [Rhodospirillaceae bacterium]|nr:UxaA family hydrolase [Rhodospirillaceae bacterium]